ncbi:MAG: ribonuclease [Clostridia bacterium]|jgi:ribonuclease HII|nr:ribonuclease [Clostridia bacterium]
MRISEIDDQLRGLSVEQLEKQLEHLKDDTRAGVMKLISKYQNKVVQHKRTIKEWALKCEFDQIFHENKAIFVGVDEVGRGPLAGPVVAAAVILPYKSSLLGLKDSKKMSEIQRDKLYQQIKDTALAVGVGIVDAQLIDDINILQATFEAMRVAIGQLNSSYDIIGVDGDKEIPFISAKQHAIIQGDDKSASIAAASVVAKVTRDRIMKEYAKVYPLYDWENNKGYGSTKHYEAIRTFGITPLHRKSFLKKEGIF